MKKILFVLSLTSIVGLVLFLGYLSVSVDEEKESVFPNTTVSDEPTSIENEMKIENKEIEIKNKIVEMYSDQFYQVDYVEVDIFKNGYGDYSCHVQLVSKEIGLAEKVDDCFIGDESFENIVHLIPYAPYTDIYKLTSQLLSDFKINNQTNIPITVYAGLKHEDGVHMSGLRCTDGIEDSPDFEQYYRLRRLINPKLR